MQKNTFIAHFTPAFSRKNRIDRTLPSIMAALICTLAVTPAQSHITLEQNSAPASSYYKATFKVGHGCDGSATTGITIQIPEGVMGAKPMPKPGWTLEIRTGKLEKPIEAHGKRITERVTQISWKGGPLPDTYYDEFVLMGQLPPEKGTLWFNVIQDCEKGQTAWTEQPSTGQSAHELAHPAPKLEVIEGATGHAH